jgi:hypothetical protein
MNHSVDWFYLLHASRARVYLLWAVLGFVGFMATHFWQVKQINAVWTLISILGLGYMWRVMPMRIGKMKQIYLSWLVPILFGMIISAAAFQIDRVAVIVPYLGVFWLLVMAVAYLWNGLVDKPMTWYVFAAIINTLAAALCYFVPEFLLYQYVVAAIITAWSMLYLWLLRT